MAAFEVCFVGLVVERICVWRLVIVFIFMGFGQAWAIRCGWCLEVLNWGWWCKSQKGTLLKWKAGSHYVIILYCKSYWVYTVKNFIGYLFSLYCCFTCLRLTTPKVQLNAQSVLMILTLNSVSLTVPLPLVCFLSL